jgi:hypothetical protein
LLKFMANDFPRTGFKKALCTRLSMTFGHIAHYNLPSYFSTFFEDETAKIDFIEQTLQWPCWGDPAFTFCDVERVIQTRLRSSGLLDLKRAQLAAQTRQRERAQFERLKAKYEPAAPETALAAAPAIAPTLTHPATPVQRFPQADLFDLFSR